MSTVAKQFWDGVLARRKAQDEAFVAELMKRSHQRKVQVQRDKKHQRKVEHKLCQALLNGGHLTASDAGTPFYLAPDHPVRIAAVETAQKLVELGYVTQRPTTVLQNYLPPDHPTRLAAQRRAQAYMPGVTTDIVRSTDRSKVDLGPQPVYAKTTTLHRRKVGNESKYLGEAKREAEFWQPDHMHENEQTFYGTKSACFSDPLAILLRKERANDVADELEQRASAGSSNNTLKFYMQQRPDTMERQAPGNAWTTTTHVDTTEVTPYVKTRRVA